MQDVVAHTFNTSTQEAETKTQGQRGLYSELQVNQGYMVRYHFRNESKDRQEGLVDKGACNQT